MTEDKIWAVQSVLKYTFSTYYDAYKLVVLRSILCETGFVRQRGKLLRNPSLMF
jgi:hypothetical protein